MRIFFLALFILFSSFQVSFAGTYWADNNGSASWANCSGVSALSGTSACSLATANSNASAGDTINLREGTYNTNIAPSNSGSSSNLIIYQAYNGEAVNITNVGNTGGIQLSGDDYIKIDGVTVHDTYQLMNITRGSSYNEIVNCTLHTGTAGANNGINIYTLYVTESTKNTHNWIHNSTIYEGGVVSQTNCGDDGGLISIGADGSYDGLSDYNTFEDNTIYWGSHHVLKTNTRYNVVRNNFIHNEGFWVASGTCEAIRCSDNGLYGNRVINVLNNHNEVSAWNSDTYNLIENNRLGDAGLASDGNGADNLTLGGERDIVRYNTIFNAMELGIYFRVAGNLADYNRVYNNTIYHNGQGPQCRDAKYPGFYKGGVRITSSAAQYNALKNNIIYNNDGKEWNDRGTGTITASNWFSGDGDPLFVNTDLSDPTSSTTPDLSLQSNSGAINNGTYLTQANGSGNNSTALIVDDALYFQYGERGSSLSNIQADWIAIGTVSNVVQISSINYSTKTITLTSPMTWSNNASIWLYKDSTGNIVLSGSAPDIGAHEYIPTGPDIYPPSLSNGSPSGTLSSGTTSVTIGLTTNEPATCKYSTTPDVTYASMANTFSKTGGVSHSTPILGLSDGNSYSFYVRCQDGLGYANTSDYIISFSVAVPDYQPPTIPGDPLASPVSSSQINLTWTSPTDNVGVAGYQIYRDGIQVDTSPTNSYSNTGLSPSTTYTYTVSAYDAAGNESSQSSSVSATTLEASSVTDAESGNLTLPMQIVSDVEASGGAYIQTTQSNSGTATYTVNIDESGVYKIISRVYALDGGSDSFYVKIDDGEEFVWHLNPSQNPDEFNVWREDEVNNQGTGTYDNPQYDPYTVELTQGAHTITFRGREANSRLDYFYFSKVEGLAAPNSPTNLQIVLE